MEAPVRILHLEDEPNDAELVRGTLAADGMAGELMQVSTREAYLSAIERGQIDLILSDFWLPGFDGVAALLIARQKMPDVPFIFVSGTIGEEAAIETLQNGATDYVLKHRLTRLVPAARRAIREAAERRKRHDAEEMLQNEREFLKAVLESLDAGVMACDAGGNLTLFNRATREFHDLPEEPPRPERWFDHYSFYERDGQTPVATERAPLARALQGEQVQGVELKILPGSGPARTVLASGQPIVDPSGRKLGAVVVLHDITQRKQLEEQLHQSQKMEAIGRLAGGVAHDFNNLLSVIQGYSELCLRHQALDLPLRRKIEQITHASERAAGLTRQLLAFSRKQIIEPKILDLNLVLAEFEKMLRRLIGADIEIVTVKAERLGRVKADPGQIEQILLNLVVNARDAMPDGGKLTIETANAYLDQAYAQHALRGPSGHYVMLAVSDTGVGMDAETQSHIFEPFFTTKPEGKGTGLGLATVYSIVQQGGGHIRMCSELGHGTEFRVYFPHVDQPADEAVADEAISSARGTETVLVIEDEETLRSVIGESLKDLGYTVLEAGDLPEAEIRCQEHQGPIHLLLTDLVLPGVSGGHAAEQLARDRPAMRILFMSGHTDDAIHHYGALHPGAHFLQKPFAVRTLGRKIREALECPEHETRTTVEIPAAASPPRS